MKRNTRLWALFLLICLLFSCTACRFLPAGNSSRRKERLPAVTAAIETTASGSTEPDTETSALLSEFSYTLTQQEIEDCYTRIKDCTTDVLSSPTSENKALDEKLDELENTFNHITTQAQLAYLAYCVDMTDETLSNNYLFASEAVTDLYSYYMEFCRAVDESDCPYRATFFSDWSEADIEEMRGYSGELAAVSAQNDQLLVEYRSLAPDDSFSEKSAKIYLQFLKNNQRIAKLQGYDDYWTYAYEKIYLRDYGKNEAARLRFYVKSEIIPFYLEIYQNFITLYNETLTRPEQKRMQSILFDDLHMIESGSYIDRYLSTFDDNTEDVMRGITDGGNAIFTSSHSSHEGAFTGFLTEYERPFCYFGPGYQNIYTVIHEMGHYYAASVSGNMDLPLDLAEIQSQGNEWLFTAYLTNEYSGRVARTVLLYQLLDSLGSIILSTLIDEFEQSCYQNMPATVSELDARMDSISKTYGGVDFVKECIADPQEYWRLVALESPVYYVSYAVSMISSLQLYCTAVEDFREGQEIYLILAEDIGEDAAFLDVLEQIGFDSPFSPDVYQKINSIFI